MTITLRYNPDAIKGSGYIYLTGADDYKYLSSGYDMLPPVCEEEKKKCVQAYDSVIEAMRKANASVPWFNFFPLACANTWQSGFYDGIESYYRLKNIDNVVVYCSSPSWFLWLSKKDNMNTSFTDKVIANICLVSALFKSLKARHQGWRFSLSRKDACISSEKINAEYIFASVWTQRGADEWLENKKDPYFGSLPMLMHKTGKNVCIVYHPENIKPVSEKGEVQVISFPSLLDKKDWRSIKRKIFFYTPFIPSVISSYKSIIKNDFLSAYDAQFPLALISYYATRNLIGSSKKKKLISLYENNCWEQGCSLAASEHGINVIGYQHTSFSPAILKMRAISKSVPRHIMASGGVAKRLLVDDMGHGKSMVTASCALRYEAKSLESLSSRKGKDYILVLLQGVPADEKLLYRIKKESVSEEILIRPHPDWSLSDIGCFPVSNNARLSEDLCGARAVLYAGTTAAFEALYFGVPVIFVDTGEAFQSDPLYALYDCQAHRIWKLNESLNDVLSDLKHIKSDDIHIARRFIDGYFQPVNDDSINRMISAL